MDSKPTDKKDSGKKQLSYEEYQALRQQKAKNHKEFKIHPVVKWILASPLIIVGLFGLWLIPYIIFRAFQPDKPNAEKSSTAVKK